MTKHILKKLKLDRNSAHSGELYKYYYTFNFNGDLLEEGYSDEVRVRNNYWNNLLSSSRDYALGKGYRNYTIERSYKYNANGNCIHEIVKHLYTDGEEEVDQEIWMEYDNNGNLIHKMWTPEDESVPETDDQLMHIRYKYDNSGNLVQKHYVPAEEVSVYEYDENNNIIYSIDDDGIEEWFNYDLKGNLISKRDSKGNKETFEYNENGDCIHSIKTDSTDILIDEHCFNYHYNENNQITSEKKVRKRGSEVRSYEKWFHYNENGDCIYKKNIEIKNNIILTDIEEWYSYLYYEDLHALSFEEMHNLFF